MVLWSWYNGGGMDGVGFFTSPGKNSKLFIMLQMVHLQLSQYTCELESGAILIAPCVNLSQCLSLKIYEFSPFDYHNPRIKLFPDCVYINGDGYRYDISETGVLAPKFFNRRKPIKVSYSDNLIKDCHASCTLNLDDYIEWSGRSLNLPIYVGDYSDIISLKGLPLTITPVTDDLGHSFLEFCTPNGFRLYIQVMEMYLDG